MWEMMFCYQKKKNGFPMVLFFYFKNSSEIGPLIKIRRYHPNHPPTSRQLDRPRKKEISDFFFW